MKIDLTMLQQKLAKGDLLGFTLAEDAKASKASTVKLGATKLVPTKLGLAKTGLTKG